jgi:Zn-dependent metalloprotease
MVDRDDWLIGEDITKTTFSPSGALRNMADPHNLGRKATITGSRNMFRNVPWN